MSLSPRTQALAAPGVPSDQGKTLFDQGLTQMAYSVLVNKLPNVSGDVATFKILDSDPEEGSGVGAFVVLRRGQTIYIPVIMAENQIKPLDVLYFKDLNIFLPLSKEWLEELDKMSLGELGRGVQAPETLSTDVDIRNTVVPPTTGRYSYATDHSAGVAQVFEEARRESSEAKLAFLDFLSKAPNRVKSATARLFETTPRLLKQAVFFYGEKPLVDALTWHEEKLADYSGKLSPTGALYIADKNTSPGEFKSLFGEKAPVAFSGVARKGYYAEDSRTTRNRAVQVQTFRDLQEPKDAGAYKLWKSDGKPVIALVIGNPVNLFKNTAGNPAPARNIRFVKVDSAPANPNRGHGAHYRVPGLDGYRDEVHVDRYVGVTEDGKLLQSTKLVGQPVSIDHLEGSAVYKKTVGDGAAAGPRQGQTGIFVQKRGASFVATTPVKIESISTDAGGVRRIEVSSGWDKRTLVTDPGSPISKLMVPVGSNIAYLPSDYVFLPTSGELVAGDLLTEPKDVLHWTLEGLVKEGAEKVIVHQPGSFRGYVIDRQEYDYVGALRKIAGEKGIAVDEAETLLDQATNDGRAEFWVLSPEKYTKVAAYLKVAAGEEQASSGEGGSADPAQQAMDQVMAAQMSQPQGPSPVDMAVAEQIQNLQQQAQALTQMQQLLMTVQQRANMIAGGGGAAAAPAAAAAAMGGPMDPSMMGAGAPVQQPMGGGAPNQMAMAQGGGAQAAGMGQPTMDPSQAQQGEMPQAMMNADDGSVESLVQQVNPQFMEQAGSLQDAGAFDAAALASMAQSPALKDMVGAYLPNLEKSLDNIGRVLLTLWMDETNIKGSIGNETFVAIEDNLRTTFKGLGDLILKINQNTLVMPGKNDPSYQE